MKKVVDYTLKIMIVICLISILRTSTKSYDKKIENNNINKTINLSTMALKVEEINELDKYSAKDTFTGDLTGYAHDCPLCNGTLGCLPSYDIKDRKNTFDDKEYGTVYIVASSKNLPCGSIIRFYSPRIQEGATFAIVLDRGVRNNDIDFLSPTEEYASKYIGRSSITYDVLRKGWPHES